MSKKIKAVLAKMEALLAVEIPKAVQNAQLREPVYCLRIFYYGTDGDEESTVPSLMLVKDAARKAFIREHGSKASYYIWCADEVPEPEQTFRMGIPSDELAVLYGQWFEHFEDLEDEDVQPLREMIQRVASQLNTVDWSGFAPVTDDFVVFPADGSHIFCDDIGELEASVPEKKVQLLRARKLLDPAE